MVDFSDTRFMAFLIFDIIAISLAVWWISRKLKSKLEEVENRKKGKTPLNAYSLLYLGHVSRLRLRHSHTEGGARPAARLRVLLLPAPSDEFML